MAFSALSAAPCFAMGGTNVTIGDIQLLVGVCTGANAICPVTATTNAIGDPFQVDPSTVQVTDLGTIAQDTKVSLAIPAEADKTNVFSFTPTQGDLKGRKVFFAIKRNAKGAPGTQFAGVEVIELFRQNVDDTNAIWFRAGRMKSKTGYPATVDFTFTPSGNASITDSSSGQSVTFNFGVRDLSKISG